MKKSDAPSFFLVIDLEATCDEGSAIPREETEIIEIGAVLVNGSSLSPVAEHQTFIRPLRHPKLTPFCTELTKITQADVDGAPLFPEAIRELTRFIDRRDALFCSWGEYDRNQFRRDAKRHGVKLPFGDHLNLKKSFSAELREERLYGMDGALHRVGLDLVGTHHRGIDDARNIARLLPYCLGWREAPRHPARSG